MQMGRNTITGYLLLGFGGDKNFNFKKRFVIKMEKIIKEEYMKKEEEQKKFLEDLKWKRKHHTELCKRRCLLNGGK
jgi:hypothetical protein